MPDTIPAWYVPAFTRSFLCFVFAALLAPLLFGAIALAPDIAWTRHTCWQVVAGTVFALLFLNSGIIHMHVVFYGRHIIVSQQFLQAERVVARHEVAHGEGMAQNVRTDAFAGDARAFAKACKQHL